MKYILILLFFITGCAASIPIQPMRYFPEGSQGRTIPYYMSISGVICSKTGDTVHAFKMSSEGEIIGSDYYMKNIQYK